jgi:nucleoside-diphosphate-sugar epimerase
MNIFIAGATGVLGRRVVPLLVSSGYHVVGLSRSGSNDELLGRLGAEPRRGDLFSEDQMRELSADCGILLHLATAIPAKARTTRRDWLLNDRIRREGTASLIAAGLRNRCELYIQQSVALLYGDRGGAWADEESEIARRQPAMLESAVDMEGLVFEAIRHHHFPGCVLRFGSFYAHDSSQTAAMFGGIRQGSFPIIGSGEAYWNLINVDDAAEAVRRTVLKGQSRSGALFTICDDEPVFYRDAVHYIARLLNAPAPRTIPRAIANVGIGRELVNLLLSSVRCRNTRARRALGWEPAYSSYREGLKAEISKWLERTLSA